MNIVELAKMPTSLDKSDYDGPALHESLTRAFHVTQHIREMIEDGSPGPDILTFLSDLDAVADLWKLYHQRAAIADKLVDHLKEREEHIQKQRVEIERLEKIVRETRGAADPGPPYAKQREERPPDAIGATVGRPFATRTDWLGGADGEGGTIYEPTQRKHLGRIAMMSPLTGWVTCDRRDCWCFAEAFEPRT